MKPGLDFVTIERTSWRSRFRIVWWWKEPWRFPFPYLFHRYDVMESRFENGKWNLACSWSGSAFRLQSAEDQKVFIETMIENRDLEFRLERLENVARTLVKSWDENLFPGRGPNISDGINHLRDLLGPRPPGAE